MFGLLCAGTAQQCGPLRLIQPMSAAKLLDQCINAHIVLLFLRDRLVPSIPQNPAISVAYATKREKASHKSCARAAIGSGFPGMVQKKTVFVERKNAVPLHTGQFPGQGSTLHAQIIPAIDARPYSA